MRIKTLLFLFAIILAQYTYGQRRYSHEKIIEDFEYLYKNLEGSHYNLYSNTNKKIYDKEFKRILESIKDSLTSLQAYRLFQPFVALDRHGHCQILFPFENYGEYYENEGTVFPLNLCFRDKKVFVLNNFSSDTTILTGNEIISVNKKPINKILNEMYAFYSRESEYFKNTIIEMITFPRLYWFIYDRIDEFNIELKDRQGNVTNSVINAITVEEFEEKNSMIEPLLNSSRDFYFMDNIAYLRPGEFMKPNAQSELETSDNREFCQFIDSVFNEIYISKAQDLVIDLRYNPGGHNSFSDYMISYIADKPFRFCSKFMVRTSELTKNSWKDLNDTTLQYLKNDIMTKENGVRFENVLPYNQLSTDSLHYKGKVYVLINRYDFSQAANAAAVIQDYKFGILIGEETADWSSLYASGQLFSLPNTGLVIQYPKAFIVRPNGNEKAKGVIPEHQVDENMFTKEDEILEYTLDFIRNGK
jgi:hypothetical protein